jgi:hypothetical protein
MLQGSTYITQDLDICYERTADNMKRLAAALAELHRRLRNAPDDVPFVFDERTLSQGMNFTLKTDLIDVDLFGELSGVGQFAQLERDSIELELYGKSYRIASLDALIRSKRAAGRVRAA